MTISSPSTEVLAKRTTPAIMVHVTLHASDDATPRGPRHERIFLRVPPNAEHPEDVDLAAIAEIVRSGVLTAEIDAANNHDPDLAV